MLKSWKDVKNNKDDFVSLDEMYDDNNKLISEFHIFLYGYFGKITSLKLIDLEALNRLSQNDIVLQDEIIIGKSNYDPSIGFNELISKHIMKKGFTREQKRNYLIWEIELDSNDCLHDFSMVKKDLNYNVMRKLIIPCSIEEKNIYHKNLYDYWEKLEDDDFIKFSGKIKAKGI